MFLLLKSKYSGVGGGCLYIRQLFLLLIFPRVSGVCSKPVPKHLRRILPIHSIGPVPPVQGVRQALPEVTGVALQWGSE